MLLLWACVTWRSWSHRHLALRSSPFLVGYTSPLVLLSFVLGLRASQEELFPGVPGWFLTDLDLKPYLQPCLHLGEKVGLWGGDGARGFSISEKIAAQG